jgi:hypothetical protein
MTGPEVKEWILTVSASVSMIAVAVGVWMSLKEYRLKLQAEGRQQRSAEVEAEIRLQTLFSDLMNIANGRSGYQVSEKTAEFVLQNLKPPNGEIDLASLNQAVEDGAILTLPVGSAAQDAAVAAIAGLTLRHKELREAGLRALESLSRTVPTGCAPAYLESVTEALDSSRSGGA